MPMQWILLPAFLAASLLHMCEEYLYPGGLTRVMKRLNPRFASQYTSRMAIAVNGLQLALCVAVLADGAAHLAFALSLAALLGINALAHVFASLKIKGYAPGVITGLALYLPLSLWAYVGSACAGRLTAAVLVESLFPGLVYQAVPLGYLALAAALRRA